MHKRLGTLVAALVLTAVAEIGSANIPTPQPMPQPRPSPSPCPVWRKQCVPAPLPCGVPGSVPCRSQALTVPDDAALVGEGEMNFDSSEEPS